MASGKWQMVNSRCVEWMDIVFPVVCSLTPLFEILINYQNQNQNQTPHLEQHIDIPTAVASPRLKNHSKHLGQIKMRIYSRHSTQLIRTKRGHTIRTHHFPRLQRASSQCIITTHGNHASNIKYQISRPHIHNATSPFPRPPKGVRRVFFITDSLHEFCPAL